MLPVFLLTQWLTREAEQARFAASAEQAAYRLARDVDLTLANLRAVKGLYKGSVHVSREEFSAFVKTLRPSAAVQSLEWIPRVPATGLAELEEAARKDGLSAFQFRDFDTDNATLAKRLEYFPIYYIEPYHGNPLSLGRDLSSDAVSLAALKRARDSGEQTASGRVQLIKGNEAQFGIVVFEPIYAETALSLDTRIKSLEGFARGVFRIADLVEEAIPKDAFQVAVFDVSAAPQERQLYPATGIESSWTEHQDVQHAVSLVIADRVWSIRLAPAAASALGTLPWFAAATWLGAFLILWTIRELVSSRRQSQQLASINQRLETLSDQRERAIEELQRSNRELDDFAYIASHDLKEPLRAIANHTKFLLEDYEDRLDQSGKKRLNRMTALSQRMQKLIGDLLYFSRLGRGELTTDVIDLNEVIGDIETSLREALERQNAVIVRTNPLPKVKGHRPHLTALFQNLIVNGINYNASKKKVLEIGYGHAADDGASTSPGHFFVRDNGIGIDEQFKDDVFRIFKRLNSDQAYGEGTGAGLSFVKKIVENHGGTIWLTSAMGEGTTFCFTLDLADGLQSQDRRLEAA